MSDDTTQTQETVRFSPFADSGTTETSNTTSPHLDKLAELKNNGQPLQNRIPESFLNGNSAETPLKKKDVKTTGFNGPFTATGSGKIEFKPTNFGDGANFEPPEAEDIPPLSKETKKKPELTENQIRGGDYLPQKNEKKGGGGEPSEAIKNFSREYNRKRKPRFLERFRLDKIESKIHPDKIKRVGKKGINPWELQKSARDELTTTK